MKPICTQAMTQYVPLLVPEFSSSTRNDSSSVSDDFVSTGSTDDDEGECGETVAIDADSARMMVEKESIGFER